MSGPVRLETVESTKIADKMLSGKTEVKSTLAIARMLLAIAS